MNETIAIVLAAGLGTRMKTEVPKVLHEVGSRPMIERVVANLEKAGAEKILSVVGYKSELVQGSLKKRSEYVLQEKLLGSGDAAARAVEKIGNFEGHVLITCGDAPLISAETFARLVERHRKEKASCTLLTCNMEDPFSYGRIIRGKGRSVLKIVEEKDASTREKNVKEINVGTYCFNAGDLKNFIKEIKINEKKKEFYLTDIIDILVKSGRKVIAESCEAEESIGINSRKDIAMVNKIISKKIVEKLMDAGITIVNPDLVDIDETAVIGKDTIIYPFTVIEKSVTVGKNCKVGPFVTLKSGAKLKDNSETGSFLELKNKKGE